VIDASVAIKWFVEETDSPAAHRLLDAHASGEASLVAPDLLVYEVANVLLHHPALTISERQRDIERLYDLDLELVAPSVDVVQATVEVAATKHMTFYDALYVQLARHLELPFYTADQKLIAKVRDFAFVRSL
jgi:predicted nucleic acid-binding protein